MLPLDKANIEEMSGHTIEESIYTTFYTIFGPILYILTSFGNKSNALFPQSMSTKVHIF